MKTSTIVALMAAIILFNGAAHACDCEHNNKSTETKKKTKKVHKHKS